MNSIFFKPDVVLQSTIIFSCASSTLETARIPKKTHHPTMKKTKTELRGGNVTLGQLLVAAQKMASAIRVQEQNPGDFGWMSCKLLGGILRCLKEKLLVLEKRLRGREEE